MICFLVKVTVFAENRSQHYGGFFLSMLMLNVIVNFSCLCFPWIHLWKWVFLFSKTLMRVSKLSAYGYGKKIYFKHVDCVIRCWEPMPFNIWTFPFIQLFSQIFPWEFRECWVSNLRKRESKVDGHFKLLIISKVEKLHIYNKWGRLDQNVRNVSVL